MNLVVSCDLEDEIVLEVIEKELNRLSRLFGDDAVMLSLNEACIDIVTAGECLRTHFQGVAIESGLKLH